jgi:glucose-6-phosphate isomerase
MDRPAFETVLDALCAYRDNEAPRDLRQAFAADTERFKQFSLTLDDLLLDWSKCAVDWRVMQLLFELAAAAGLEARRDAMFAGKRINATENRAVLHVALRAPRGGTFTVDGKEVLPEVHAVLDAMASFATEVRSGELRGATDEAITDIVNIGIGGSDLGPAMATAALAPYHDGPRAHFVSNVDGAHISDTLAGMQPQSTLFIVASKTFTTMETITNALTARRWLESALGSDAVASHFAAVSTAIPKAAEFGIPQDRVFGFWDWVGGRYSLWSAIGLPIMIAVGPDNFRAMLAGAHAMDEHFRYAPLSENLPAVLGLIGFWHRAVCGYPARAVVPYDQRLARLPAYLQQLDMESNGKSVMVDGEPVATPTGPLIWGEPGTNGQHAFFQLLHQGTDVVPVEFIVAAEAHEPELRHHELLLANCLAQSQALMKGRSEEEARAQLMAAGMDPARAAELAPHRVFAGNRPSVTLVHRRLDPYTLGRLVALYEHRVFVEAQLFGVNAFDQWGVELGKELATALLPVVEGGKDTGDLDASTAGLVAHLRGLKGGATN